MELILKPQINGKTVVITGGSGVLCREFAGHMAQCGAKIVIIGKTPDKDKAVAGEICRAGGEAIAVQADVTDKKSVKAAHEEVLSRYGKCDILINGAGGNHPGATTDHEYYEVGDIDGDTKSFFNLDDEGVKFVFNLNFIGTLIPTQEFAGDMIGRRGCNIINISSMNAYTPLTKIPAYSGAKAAVSNFTRWLAVYFSREGIRVNAIAPGFFSTAQNRQLLWNEDGSPTVRTEKILNATPMSRFGEPHELLGALMFLVDDNASSFVTGAVIPVDGGFSAYSGV